MASHQPAQHRIQMRRPRLLRSVLPVFMKLNDAQTIVDPEGDLRDLRVRCELGHGCQITSRRCVDFLAEECVAELLEQFACFHWLSWFVGQAARLNFLRPSSPNRCTSRSEEHT